MRAQQDMSAWALVLTWFGAIGTLMSAAGILLVYRNLIETRGIGQNQARAFVYAASATLDFPERASGPPNAWAQMPCIGPPLFVRLRIANLGATPAVEIDAVARLVLAEAGKKSEVPLEMKEE